VIHYLVWNALLADLFDGTIPADPTELDAFSSTACDDCGGGLGDAFRVLIASTGLVGGGVYEYAAATWTLRSNGLPNEILYGSNVVANPYNANEWLALFPRNSNGALAISNGKIVNSGFTESPLWRWDGSTWHEVTLSFAGPFRSGAVRTLIASIAWDEHGPGKWFATIVQGRHNDQYGLVLTGTGNASTSAVETYSNSFGRCTSGTDGQLILHEEREDPAAIFYFDGSSFIEPSGSDVLSDGTTYFDKEPGTGRAIVVARSSNANIYGAQDYRVSQPTLLASGEGRSIAWTTHGVYIGGRGGTTRTGMGLLSNPFSAPSVSDVAHIGTSLADVRADRQTRTVVVALDSVKSKVLAYDGTNEIEITIPGTINSSNLADFVEVIVDS
jgi:hypothetical protein